MKHLRKNGGFTLVELVISIAVASLVTMAATTVLMLALRVNRQTADTATQQYTVRSLLTAVENAAMDGIIKSVKTDHLNYWELCNDEGDVIFRYSAFDKEITVNGTAVLKGIQASNATLEVNLLNIVLVTQEGSFDTSIYCRGWVPQEDNATSTEPAPENEPPVEKFLRVLASQLGSRGAIVYATEPGNEAPKYYSEWYIGGYDQNPDWNSSTPWCACYVSWALTEAGFPGPADYKTTVDGKEFAHGNWFASVNDFMNFCNQESSQYGQSWASDPTVGSLIFFNLDGDEQADHIGVVVNVHGGVVYTIEGNNEGKVTLASYPLTDARILGYGVVIS